MSCRRATPACRARSQLEYARAERPSGFPKSSSLTSHPPRDVVALDSGLWLPRPLIARRRCNEVAATHLRQRGGELHYAERCPSAVTWTWRGAVATFATTTSHRPGLAVRLSWAPRSSRRPAPPE